MATSLRFSQFGSVLLVLLVLKLCVSVSSAGSVCYGDLGCFHTAGTLTNLPASPNVISTTFILHLRGQLNAAHMPATDSPDQWHSSLASSGFSIARETKVITHGYTDTGTVPWVVSMVQELLQHGDYNVFVTDWRHGSHATYGQAVANSLLVASQIAKFINSLRTSEHLVPARLHLIGHSLGAQASGNAGSRISGLGRISALDPAEPYFKTELTDADRLDKSDALFVDVIHTDGENFNVLQGYGLMDPVGHVDFYPNGGVDQPGCTDNAVSGLLGILQGNQGDQNIACSHSRSYQYFTESINLQGCHFYAHLCASWNDYESGLCHGCPKGGCPEMGFNVGTSARGLYYLSTAQSSPFCGHEYFVEMDLSGKRQNAFGRIYLTFLGAAGDSSEIEFTRNNRHYHENDQEKHMVAIHSEVGQVTGVKVRFHRGNGVPSYGTDHEITVHKITLEDAVTQHSTVFCTQDVPMPEDNAVTFRSHGHC